ncbi:ATP-binding cassette domain-containing protein [Deinococcus sp. HMF7604]|uniref:ABC transporter ATP-binding protein n=1 Tax=Deinococcus betulae TaxID=2873312 RepID=UPI001CD02561|nr:ATP-binding cassette domain-containing protein [Deinococcus betulae]MBZ9751658.1 ATP-binding cassette domain-containing protein [Deinococcus betulae]
MAAGVKKAGGGATVAPPEPASSHALQLRGVWLRLGREAVLRGLEVDIPAGQGVTLLGENGAGKTTLLRLLAAGLRPTRGEGRLLGYDLRDSRAVRGVTHLMPVDGGLYPDLTGAENLRFALQMHGQSGDVAGALRRTGLTGAAERRARFFSAGMRKRLALARAHLLARPLTLVDEPFANLDEGGRALVQELLTELRAQGVTLIIAAHEPALAQAVAPRTLRLAGGQLHEEHRA